MKIPKCRERRKELKMTLLDLAVKVGCSIATVQNAEKGNSINTNNAKRIASGLRTDLEKLI